MGQVMGDMSREPSMEEILSSIRRVIARDEAARDDAIEARFGDAETIAETTAEIATETANDDDSDDVLDLTADLSADFSTADLGEVDSLVEVAEHVLPVPPEPTIAAAAGPALVSTDSAVAARQSIAALTAVLTQDIDKAVINPAAATGMTIEALAEAALRPMLKQWLDSNLPPLVERLVAREIARITGGRI